MNQRRLKQKLNIFGLLVLLVVCSGDVDGAMPLPPAPAAPAPAPAAPAPAATAPAASQNTPVVLVSGDRTESRGETAPFVAQLMGYFTALNWVETQREKTKLLPDTEERTKKLGALLDQERRIIGLLGDSGFGRAILVGFAGSDAKAMQYIPVRNVPEGIGLGLVMQMSKACSKVLELRIATVAENVVGGGWDFFATNLGKMWNSVFHGGKKAYTGKQLAGWQTLVRCSFTDINKLLTDGLRDFGRGQDMTLREPADQIEETSKVSVWQGLIESYVRQFDFIVSQIDKHLTYYSEKDDDVIVNYSKEIQCLLLGTKKALLTCKSIKELDALLDSSKSLMVALGKQIENNFDRLKEQIESQANQTKVTTSSSTPSRSYGSGRDTSSSDDNDYPHSFR